MRPSCEKGRSAACGPLARLTGACEGRLAVFGIGSGKVLVQCLKVAPGEAAEAHEGGRRRDNSIRFPCGLWSVANVKHASRFGRDSRIQPIVNLPFALGISHVAGVAIAKQIFVAAPHRDDEVVFNGKN